MTKKSKLQNLQPGEKALIAAIRSRTSRRQGVLRLGIGDDCAILRPKSGSELTITTDFSLEKVHFRRDWHPPESVGHRCLARGLSDLAAMGATPVAAFLSLAVPAALTVRHGKTASWTERFMNGLLELADNAGVPLAGGDTAQSPAVGGESLVAADIVLVGSVPQGKAFLRSGARAGDAIYVTGSLGGAAAELLALERSPSNFAKKTRALATHPHLYPIPRLDIGKALLTRKLATAAIDVSDGLSTDLAHLCEESALAAEIDESAIPVHFLAKKAESDGWIPSALDLALHGGEDYELLFAAPAKAIVPAKIAGVAIHRIGKMKTHRKGRSLVELKKKDCTSIAVTVGGWEHFR